MGDTPGAHTGTLALGFSSFAVCVASILGTGILAFPDALYACPAPAVGALGASSTFAQVGAVIIMIELIQCAAAWMPVTERAKLHSASAEAERGSLVSKDIGSVETPRSTDDAPLPEPSLYELAELFLTSPWLKALFYAMIQMHFVATIVSYGLAAPQAYRELLRHIFPAAFALDQPLSWWQSSGMAFSFSFFMSACVLTFLHGWQRALSTMSAVKAVLLLCVVAMIGILWNKAAAVDSLSSDLGQQESMQSCGEVFLLWTISVGGSVNALPVLYSWVLLEKGVVDEADLSTIRRAALFAVVFCALLVAFYACAVFYLVGPVELKLAHDAGEMSTVLLMRSLMRLNGRTGVLALKIMVDFFVAASVTVSFILMAVAMRHFLHAASIALAKHISSNGRNILSWLAEPLMYVVWFGLICVLVILNPRGFLRALEVFASMALNMQTGVFLAWMLWCARAQNLVSTIANSMGRATAWFWISIVGIYYAIAVLYDIVFSITS
ncbi:hypothetical protein FVE85_3767 [Porphyridium purpureum]|uniref:Uncharacterized protein n=1 Tax=Porphyridium purpureum TaxID=35688 RepID=A0A5J4YLH1_PORPP|nr:hypothetical protein FVE85_3767 [Porphyridium purpureum]|eukprot:POR3735..scf249_10